jgi:multidrug efflux pump
MMCSRILRHKPEAKQGRLYRASERVFDGVVKFYDTTLQWVLRHQVITLLVGGGDPGADRAGVHRDPEGFFPVQDTGLILGVSEAPQSISFAAMAERQQALAQVILRDPRGREPLVLHRHRRRQHDAQQRARPDQPEAARGARGERERRDPPAAAGAGERAGITLFMQPVQDLTVEDQVSRTQFQYSLQIPMPRSSRVGAEARRAAARAAELRDVAHDLQDQGLQLRLVIDRDTASRLGITPQMIDDALYDAFGQRQISTMFTQLNQYHVVLEVEPDFKRKPADLEHMYLTSATGGQVPLSAIVTPETTTAPLVINHLGQFPPRRSRSTWRRGCRWATRWQRSRAR